MEHSVFNLSESNGVELSKPSEAECRVFTFVVYVVIFGSMCIFGLVGNSLSFVVMELDRHRHSATFLLQVMAVIDSAFLLTTGVSQIFAAMTIFLKFDCHPFTAYLQTYIWPLVHITQLGTVWITVLISFNRFIAICMPFRATALCTTTRVRVQVGAMALFIVVYNLPRFYEFRIEEIWSDDFNCTMKRGLETTLKLSPIYNILYENVLYLLFVFLGPLAILAVLNYHLVRELWRAHRRLVNRQLPNSVTGDDQEQNITHVMLVIVLVFLVCQTPAYVNQLLYYLLGVEAYACGHFYFYYYHISNLVVSANSAVNFVVYCVFRRQFRQRLRALCRGKHGQLGSQFDDSAIERPITGTLGRHTSNYLPVDRQNVSSYKTKIAETSCNY